MPRRGTRRVLIAVFAIGMAGPACNGGDGSDADAAVPDIADARVPTCVEEQIWPVRPEDVASWHLDGPPMIAQVFVTELATVGSISRPVLGLAFGDHPDIPVDQDDRTVTAAFPWRAEQLIIVVLDEPVMGSSVEGVLCADGIVDEVADDTSLEDVSECSSATSDLSACSAVCAEHMGIQDEDEDGAVDAFRMLDFGGACPDGCMLAVEVVCDGISIPLDRDSLLNIDRSQYQIRGDQRFAVDGVMGLGPALHLVPRFGLPAGSECGLRFRSSVTDCDGNQVCAPAGGDYENEQCAGPGDTSLVSFGVQPMFLDGSAPADGATDVSPTWQGESFGRVVLMLNARVDVTSLAGRVTVVADGAPSPLDATVALEPGHDTDINIDVPGGFLPNTTHTVTVDAGIEDLVGGVLDSPISISFKTGDGV